MCEYCKVEPNGDVENVKAIVDSEHGSFRAEIFLLNDDLAINIDVDDMELVTFWDKLKYCPMCGRKLQERREVKND